MPCFVMGSVGTMLAISMGKPVLALAVIEQFPAEYCKTKTKVILPLANHIRRIQRNEPIRNQSKQIHATVAKRGKTHASQSRLVLVLFLIGSECGTILPTLVTGRSKAKLKQTQNFGRLK